MRTVIQRVSGAKVEVDGQICGEIGLGLLILVGIEQIDDQSDIEWLIGKLLKLRIFSDSAGQMNLDIGQAGGGLLVVSQFTLHAATRKGNRPSFMRAAEPAQARELYGKFIDRLRTTASVPVQTGEFAADMKVHLINDGPVTILIDSRARE
jgi:D-tyrosyl-tRNA(Tyr) deacylase